MEKNKKKSLENVLSPEAKGGLMLNYWPGILDKPELIAELGIEPLERAIGLCRRSLREISEVLNKLGYIDSAEKWLES